MRIFLAMSFAILGLAASTQAQDKPTVVLGSIKTAAGVAWPYDMKQLENQLIAELQNRDGKKLNIIAQPPDVSTRYYLLECQVLEWHPGNAAKRALVGMGSGRESARISYSLSDQSGKKLFGHEDTVRAEFWGSAYAGSVGQLSHPIADKIAGRLADVKLQ